MKPVHVTIVKSITAELILRQVIRTLNMGAGVPENAAAEEFRFGVYMLACSMAEQCDLPKHRELTLKVDIQWLCEGRRELDGGWLLQAEINQLNLRPETQKEPSVGRSTVRSAS